MEDCRSSVKCKHLLSMKSLLFYWQLEVLLAIIPRVWSFPCWCRPPALWSSGSPWCQCRASLADLSSGISRPPLSVSHYSDPWRLSRLPPLGETPTDRRCLGRIIIVIVCYSCWRDERQGTTVRHDAVITGGQHTQVKPYVILWGHWLGTEVWTEHHVRMVAQVSLNSVEDDQYNFTSCLILPLSIYYHHWQPGTEPCCRHRCIFS